VYDGTEFELDTLIYATGFAVQRTGIYNDIRGIGGLELNEKYKDGMRTVFGVHSQGYPNLFIMGGYQANFQFNLTFMLQTQAEYIADVVQYTRENGHKSIDPTDNTEQWWVDEVVKNRARTDRNKQCTPGYYNFEGEAQRNQDGNYNGSFEQYYQHMQTLKQGMTQFFNFG
jgi:cation diffusion facilitator CzcD-associated flavoprotein CzcO